MRALPEGYFNAVIDKGTFDSIVCGEGAAPNAAQMLGEIYKVLAPNGVYICISYGNKELREEYLGSKDFDWTMTHLRINKPEVSTAAIPKAEINDDKHFHQIYILRKPAAQ